MAELVLGISRTCQRAVPICQGTPPLISWRWGAWVLFTSESQGSLSGGEATFQAPSPRWTWAHHYRVNKVCLLDIVGVSGCSFWVRSVQFSHSVVSNSLRPYGLQYTRLPCPSPTPGAYANSCPSSKLCNPSLKPFLLPLLLCVCAPGTSIIRH